MYAVQREGNVFTGIFCPHWVGGSQSQVLFQVSGPRFFLERLSQSCPSQGLHQSCPSKGVPQSSPRGYPVLARGYPVLAWGYPVLAWGVCQSQLGRYQRTGVSPDQDRTGVPLAGTGLAYPPPPTRRGLGYPLARTGLGYPWAGKGLG